MTRMVRCLLGLLLAVPFLGTAAAMAPDATPMVICSSGQARTVWLDPEGVPTEVPPECADCIACAAAVVGPLPVRIGQPEMVLRGMALQPVVRSRGTPAIHRQSRMPRGPPTRNGGAGMPQADAMNALSASICPHRDPVRAAGVRIGGRA